MSSSKQRALNAFRAMRNLGIPAEDIKPNLKKLLRIYENNWELIERENYGALADFIFEAQHKEEKEDHKVKEEDFAAPLSNPLLEEGFPVKRPKLENLGHLGGGGDGGGEGKWLISGTFGGSGSKRPLDQDNASVRKASIKTASNPQLSYSEFEIAESELGEVRLSMLLALEKSHHRMPNLDEVFKSVEEKCMNTYQIKDPNFSLKKLMEDLCEACLEAGTKPENKGSTVVVHPTANNLLSLDGKVQRNWKDSTSLY